MSLEDPKVAETVGRLLVPIASWVAGVLDQGGDPEAEFRALTAVADVTIEESIRKKFLGG
jgi:hypothetical protein